MKGCTRNAKPDGPCCGVWSSPPACVSPRVTGNSPWEQAPHPRCQVDPKTGALIVPLGGLVSFDPKTGSSRFGRRVPRGHPPGAVDPMTRSCSTDRRQHRPGAADGELRQGPQEGVRRGRAAGPEPAAEHDQADGADGRGRGQPGLGHVIILSGYVTSPQDADIVTRLATSAVGGRRTTSSTRSRSAACSRCRSTWWSRRWTGT